MKTTQMDLRAKESKVGFAAVFPDITRRGALPKEVSIDSNKTTMKKI